MRYADEQRSFPPGNRKKKENKMDNNRNVLQPERNVMAPYIRAILCCCYVISVQNMIKRSRGEVGGANPVMDKREQRVRRTEMVTAVAAVAV
jgi:hypothetical protein